MNIPVNFEISKLLKEKGFDVPTTKCYAEERFIDKNTGGDLFTGVFRLCTKSRFHKRYYYAPTIAEIIIWLYEKHGIWIQPTICSDKTFKVGCIELNNYPLVEHIVRNKNEQLYFNSSTEAYESAIEHTLKNLLP